MANNAKLKFLGTGGSMGIPVIGCTCAVCSSDDPHNKRFRPSVLLHLQNKTILLDCTPDYRTQALAHHISQLDGVILTHAHHDHTGGIDDLRMHSMWSGEPVPVLLSQETAEDIQLRYAYMFKSQQNSLTTKMALQVLEGERGEVEFQKIPMKFFTYVQAGMSVNGFRFGDLAYVSDIYDYPESIFEDLSGVKQLVVSALRFNPSPLHFTVDQAVDFVERVGCERAWFTHIAHELDHEKTNAYLPEHIRLAYDGLEVSFKAS